MQVSGCRVGWANGATLPILPGKVVAANGNRIAEQFLIDTGADHTVLSAAVLGKSNLPTRSLPSDLALAGIGGRADSAVVDTVLVFVRENGSVVIIRGEFAAFLHEKSSDLSILGRDVRDNFDVIISRRRNEVLLLAGQHRYSIEVES